MKQHDTARCTNWRSGRFVCKKTHRMKLSLQQPAGIAAEDVLLLRVG